MENSTATDASAKTNTPDQAKMMVTKDIIAKWSHFSEQDVAALKAEQERWRDPAYVEQQARQRLKFVKPGERSYTVLDAKPATGTKDPVPELAAPDVPLPWYQTVWQSTHTADVPGARR